MHRKLASKQSLDIALGLLFLSICICRLQDFATLSLQQSSDLCWLIRTGDWILSNGIIPDRDLFNWYLPNRTVISYQWLFEVLISAFHQFIGLWGIGFLSNTAAALLLLWLLPTMWFRYSIPMSLVFLFDGLVISKYWQFPRPQLLASIYMFCLLWLLEKVCSENKLRPLLFLPILVLLWINTHPSFGFALIICAIYFLCVAYRKPEWRIKLFGMQLVLLLLIFVNPFGIQLISHSLSFANGSQYLNLYETLPAFQIPELAPFVAYSAISFVLIWLARKQLRIEQILVAIFSISLGLAVNRFEPFAVIGSWNCVGLSLLYLKNTYTPGFDARIPSLFHRPIGLLISVLVGALVWVSVAPNEASALRLLIPSSPEILKLPVARHKERVFNDPIIGNWMIYGKFGRPFIDNRFDTHPSRNIVELSSCLSGDSNWRQYLDSRKIDSILLPNADPLYKILIKSSHWVNIADDGQVSYWERANLNEQTQPKEKGLSAP